MESLLTERKLDFQGDRIRPTTAPAVFAAGEKKALDLSGTQGDTLPGKGSASADMNAPKSETARWFAEQVQPHEPALRGYLRGSFPAVRDVDDVVQESYLRVWRACVNQPIRSGRSFLFQVARRIAIDFVRRERVSPLVPACEATVAAAVAAGPDCAEAAVRADDLDLLARAFEALSPRRREVMLLRKIEGVPQKEIAARLGITEAAVQIHVVRGLRDLEEFFDGCEARRPAP